MHMKRICLALNRKEFLVAVYISVDPNGGIEHFFLFAYF